MKRKKYKGQTEEEVIQIAKEELGSDAIVLSIKKITPKGIFSVMKKPYIELIASYDENKVDFSKKIDIVKKVDEDYEKQLDEKDYVIERLEKRVVDLEEYLEKALKDLSKTSNTATSRYENQMIQFIYDMLIKQGVLSKICEELLEELDNKDNQNIDLIVEVVYTRIVELLNKVVCKEYIINNDIKEDKIAHKIVFLGTTGVGKTTTIAKLSSHIIMNKGKRVGFITADTYRIAAVEQLRVYADILGSQVEVVYNPEEVQEKIDKLSIINNFIFFDTAGRSHKNTKNMKEIKELISKLDKPEIFLVISSTSRFTDIKNIIEAYQKFAEFKIIFTKVDETSTLGSILNVAYTFDTQMAYITTGQNVPSDIEEFSADKVAKVLLGSMYE